MRALIPLLVLAAACRKDPPLFENRSDLAPLRARLTATGGDPSRVLRVRAVTDLLQLEPGRRYRFALLGDGALRVAPLHADVPNNEYVHAILADGAPVRSAGWIIVKHDGRAVTGAMVDRNSRSYCPSAQSVTATIEALRALGIPRPRITVDPEPPSCVTPRTT